MIDVGQNNRRTGRTTRMLLQVHEAAETKQVIVLAHDHHFARMLEDMYIKSFGPLNGKIMFTSVNGKNLKNFIRGRDIDVFVDHVVVERLAELQIHDICGI